MKERPILFSAPMVRAINEGRKTQTRRVVKLFDGNHADKAGCFRRALPGERGEWVQYCAGGAWTEVRCPYGEPGDFLWVRETWGLLFDNDPDEQPTFWRADYTAEDERTTALPSRWRPSIHMPRARSRITLKVTDVRVERLQEITREDAAAEGVCHMADASPRAPYILPSNWPEQNYAALWGEINGPGSWASNPWVWVISFERVQP